jgi:basic amino acid/polyamine antiporter, APA family
LPAFIIVMIITGLLSRGMRESARVNNIMVIVKLAVVLLFIATGVWYVKPANWTPFMPFGFGGVVTGAATVFFAYIGFDAVSTAAEEVRRPQRDLPIGIFSSLIVCTILYIVVSAILTGIVPYTELNVSNPVAFALNYIHKDGLAGFISLGAITGITTVLLVMLYGQIRVSFAMSRDGLLPEFFSRLHPKFQTPYRNTWVTGFIAALVASFVDLGTLASLVNMGTLSAFVLVAIAVIILRKTHPELPRSFRAPAVPLLPILAVLSCGYLMISLPAETWIAFIIWLAIGLLVYFLYGQKHSRLNK